jgi:hypothetical protein
VLAGASNPNRGNLTAALVAQPASGGGDATITPDGALTFVPQRGFAGTAVFNFTADNARGQTATGTVTIVVIGECQ